MKIAVIGDIHGDKDALYDVINAIDKEVDGIYSTGDLVGYKQYPNEVINMMREHHVQVVQGNHDRKVGIAENLEIEPYCYITDDNIAYLLQLPVNQEFLIDGHKILLFHSHPLEEDSYLFDKDELLEPLVKECPYDVFIFGHTHVPYYREVQGKHFVNVGSVGLIKDGTTRSSYAIIKFQDGKIFADINYLDRE